MQPQSSLPQSIELLVRKAAVDVEFRDALLADPAQAAAGIELELNSAELMMLRAIPREQLAAIIEKTKIPETHRRAFLLTSAASIVAAVGAMTPANVAGGLAIGLGASGGCTRNIPRPRPWGPEPINPPGDHNRPEPINPVQPQPPKPIKPPEPKDKGLNEFKPKTPADRTSLVSSTQAEVKRQVARLLGIAVTDTRLILSANLAKLGLDNRGRRLLSSRLNSAVSTHVPIKEFIKAKAIEDIALMCGRAKHIVDSTRAAKKARSEAQDRFEKEEKDKKKKPKPPSKKSGWSGGSFGLRP